MYVVCPVHNAEDYLANFLHDLSLQSKKNQLVLIDSGSTDNTIDIFQDYNGSKKIIKGKNDWWWTRSVNEGIKYCINDNKYQNILLINVDVRFNSRYLENIYNGKRSESEIVGSAIFNVSNSEPVDLGYYNTNYLLATNKSYSINELKTSERLTVNKLFGRGTLFDRSIFLKLGLFDESFPQYYADELYTVKAKRNGFQLFVATNAILYSHTKENLLSRLANEDKLKNLKTFLMYQYSPGHWKMRYRAAKSLAPRGLRTWFFMLDMIRHLIRYFRA